MDEKLIGSIFDLIIQQNQKELKNAQNRFVKMHYENARLIGCKGITNLMGKTYQLGIAEFENRVKALSQLNEKGSEIVFDYTEQYSYRQIESLMSRCGYLIYEHLSSDEMARIDAPAGFHFVLAVKK